MGFGTRYRGVVDQVEASTAGLVGASPVGLLITLLVQAVSVAVVDNVPRSSSPTRDKCAGGSHIARWFGGCIATLYILQAWKLVIPISYVMLILRSHLYVRYESRNQNDMSRPVGSHERREPTHWFTWSR